MSDTTYKGNGERTLTEAFVDAIAEAEGVTPTKLPSLYESVDFDTLTELMGHPREGVDGDLLLALRIGNWNVFVGNDGRIRVCDAAMETEPEPIFEEKTA